MVFRFLMRLVLVFTVLAPLESADAETAPGLETALNATFLVRSNDLEQTLLGSAFRFFKPGLAVTNAHVVGVAETVMLISADGATLIARVIARDDLRDIAILEIPKQGGFLQSSRQQNTIVGQNVYAIGAPFGAIFSVTRGIVSAPKRQIEANVPIHMIQHDAPVNPGSSGGPLVDNNGNLVGMNSQIVDGFRHFIGISYAIPAPKLYEIVALLLAGESAPNLKMGLRLRPVTPKIAQALGMDQATGVLIDDVRPNNLADQAGIQAGDVLLELGTMKITTPGDIAFALEGMVEAGRGRAVIVRHGGKVELQFDLPSSNQPKEIVDARVPDTKNRYALSDFGLEFEPDGKITSVTKNSLAQYAGLSVGDRFLAVDGQVIDSIDWLLSIRISAPALVLVSLSDGSTRHFVLDPWKKRGRLMPVSGANVLDQAIVIF